MRELSHSIRLLQPEDYRSMPWKNGLGMTTEIAVSPMDAALHGKPFDWRMSLANVEKDCEFSRFPGYDRSIMLIEGAGMELSFDSTPSQRIDQRYEPFRFNGGWQTRCRLLDGRVRDFNVMSRREIFTHTCEVFASPSPIHLEPHSESVLIYCLNGGFHLEGSQQKQIEMNRGQTLILDKRADLPGYKNLQISGSSKDMIMVFVTISLL